MAELKSYVTPKAYITESPIAGKGLFAKEPILAGETVVKFAGHYVNKEQAMEFERTGKLVMQWDEDLFSVEDRGDDDGYFINHSCDGDLWMHDAYTLVARHDIPAGQEITADYALWECDPEYISKWECKCGRRDCRGRVFGTDWQKPDVAKKYSGHFSPLINKLTANISE